MGRRSECESESPIAVAPPGRTGPVLVARELTTGAGDYRANGRLDKLKVIPDDQGCVLGDEALELMSQRHPWLFASFRALASSIAACPCRSRPSVMIRSMLFLPCSVASKLGPA